MASIPVAVDDALQELGAGRPLGTTAAGPYGVGGPELPAQPTTTTTTTASTLSAPAGEEAEAKTVAPQSKSIGDGSSSEPTQAATPTTENNTAVKLAAAEPTATATPSASSTPKPAKTATPQANTATSQPKATASATEPERPTVRGPIEFDSQKQQTETTPSASGGQTTGTEPSTGTASTAAAAGDKDAA